MGDIADGLINGDFDSVTGEYLGEGDGYPRTRTKKKKIHSNSNNVKGIIKYLESKGFNSVRRTELINEYHALDKHNQSNRALKRDSERQKCVFISHNFQDFASFINKKLLNK